MGWCICERDLNNKKYHIKFMCLVKTNKKIYFLVMKVIFEDYGEFGGCRWGETNVDGPGIIHFSSTVVEQEASPAIWDNSVER